MTALRSVFQVKGVSLANLCPTLRAYSSTASQKICIVGAGPAGFYAAQHIVKNLPNACVDIVEKLPVPFGLVRYGVAPDHPEVKNVISTFTKTAQNPNVNFLGNVSLGKDCSLSELRDLYHCVLLTYGAEQDRKLNLANEDSFKNVLSAREFVAFYNGLPGAENLPVDLSGKSVSIVGQGNVAVDVARILLSPIELLEKTDITEYALEKLRRSQVERVNLIGRRGPLQAAFTIKELREMLKLSNCKTVWRPEDFVNIPEKTKDLPRPRKRITELMLDSLSKQSLKVGEKERVFAPIFLRSPEAIEEASPSGYNLQLTVNELDGESAKPTNARDSIQSDLILRSIGYKSISYDSNLNFNVKAGLVNNNDGRVLKTGSADIDPGLYVAGWLSTGPLGVILTTMNNAFKIGHSICEDFKQGKIPNISDSKPGIEELLRQKNITPVTWSGWGKIDEEEQNRGAKLGKPREKIVDVKEMLKVAE